MENTSASIMGILYVVATPIGNLEDISYRAISTLKKVDTILAEDTRHSLPLLKALDIHKPLISLHAHNETDKSEQIIASLKKGQSFALISDAGTPLISDPGFVLVRHARQAGIRIIPIPGPCALVTALCVAGVPCDNFIFAGFLPAKQKARRTKLESLSNSNYTVVVYESTHRIVECLDDIMEIYGDNYQLVLAKEITKSFEHIVQAAVPEIKEWLLAENAHTKGEFVLILPAKPETMSTTDNYEHILTTLLSELSLKQAVKLTSLLTKRSKNDLYKIALELSNNGR